LSTPASRSCAPNTFRPSRKICRRRVPIYMYIYLYISLYLYLYTSACIYLSHIIFSIYSLPRSCAPNTFRRSLISQEGESLSICIYPYTSLYIYLYTSASIYLSHITLSIYSLRSCARNIFRPSQKMSRRRVPIYMFIPVYLSLHTCMYVNLSIYLPIFLSYSMARNTLRPSLEISRRWAPSVHTCNSIYSIYICVRIYRNLSMHHIIYRCSALRVENIPAITHDLQKVSPYPYVYTRISLSIDTYIEVQVSIYPISYSLYIVYHEAARGIHSGDH